MLKALFADNKEGKQGPFRHRSDRDTFGRADDRQKRERWRRRKKAGEKR